MARTPPDSPAGELQRIDFSGTVWFGAVLLATAIPLAGLLAAGWRPSELPTLAAIVWWAGSALVAAGIGAIAWAGCPVLRTDVRAADHVKSLAIRLGLALFGAGALAALLAILLT